MRCILRLLSFVLLTCAGTAWSQASPQRINPNTQIDWAQAVNCNLSGYAYIPYSSSCAPSASGSFFPLVGGRLAQSGTFEGSYYANEWQYPTNTGNNGISQILAYCSTNSIVPCPISAPSIYSSTDLPAWTYINTAQGEVGPQTSITQQASLYDLRTNSFNRTHIAPYSYSQLSICASTGNCPSIGEQVFTQFTNPAVANQRYAGYFGSYFYTSQTQGGRNAPDGKTSLTPLRVVVQGNTSGQKYGTAIAARGFAPGDVEGNEIYVDGPGGYADIFDEGLGVTTSYVSTGINVYRGLLATGGTTGSTAVTITPATPGSGANEVINGTQGERRWLLDTSLASTFTATAVTDNVQQQGSTYQYFSTITGTGFPISTFYGSSTSAITTPSTAQTPGTQSFTFTGTGTLTTGIACYADQTAAGNSLGGQGYFDTVNVTSVSGSSATASGFQYAHPAGAAIFQGGDCVPDFVSIVQDEVPTGTPWSNGESGGITDYPVRTPGRCWDLSTA